MLIVRHYAPLPVGCCHVPTFMGVVISLFGEHFFFVKSDSSPVVPWPTEAHLIVLILTASFRDLSRSFDHGCRVKTDRRDLVWKNGLSQNVSFSGENV